MWTSDIYLKMYIESDQRQRLADARCAQMTSRAVRQHRLLQTLARVQHELDAADVRDRTRRAPQPVADCQ
jgi:hypothetical protein